MVWQGVGLLRIPSPQMTPDQGRSRIFKYTVASCQLSSVKFGSLILGISDDSLSPLDKRSGLQGIPWKDFSRVGFSLGKEDQLTGKSTGKNSFGKKGDHSGAVRKSK
ncbi:hypothetical protein Pint_34183 [Pistacia integerrima]|uniref:Uncharacterized protein n=1 Tax=Pistacia integerrima TaxID=434235 RepID=A0ACC0X5C0_9ROSI|nr:hypothetical protein Pint_34183 [Pistacia integerrima]